MRMSVPLSEHYVDMRLVVNLQPTGRLVTVLLQAVIEASRLALKAVALAVNIYCKRY